MESNTVKDLMFTLSEYATVSKDATLYDAVLALEKAQKDFDLTRYPHRAVLVFDDNNKVVGKISQIDILRALEPKYEKMGDLRSLSRFGVSPKFLKSLREQFRLWEKPLNDICRKAAKLKVESFMHSPTLGEYVDENASLDEALHRLVMGHHQSLLVTRADEIVGILKLTDVFSEICKKIKACGT